MALRKKKADDEVDLTISEELSDGSTDNLEAEVPREIEDTHSSEDSAGPEKKKKMPKRKARRSETESEKDQTVEEAPGSEEEVPEKELPKGIRKLKKKHYRESSHEELYEEDAPELTSGVRKLRRRHYAETKKDMDKAGVLTYGDVLNNKWQGSWLQANWRPIVILLFIFFFALFIRSYYGAGPATQDGFILSGGSDSYYHNWVIDNTMNTGKHYFNDDMINYPVGSRNPRPPLYDWSVNLGGIALTPFFGGDVLDATWYVFLYSTAFWGALTIIPTYLLATEAFGRKTGYISALLLAIMPGHIQRSVLSNADHDAMILFFIVFCFYFFFRALKSLSEKSWVESWRRPRAIKDGLFAMLDANMDAVIYALLAGLSLAAVALIWKGYAYVLVILTAYFLIQILLDRFRNSDSTEVLMAYVLTVGSALLLIFPYYYLSIQLSGWFDTPTFMFLGASALGAVFIVTRKLPWLLVLGALVLLTIIGMAVMAIASPETLDTVLKTVGSGAGYFIRNKQYETIAEAQAPPFSNLALSFGAFTFWLSFVGVAWAMYQLPKHLKFDYVFVVIWTAAGIFMATNAARFMFNAAPVFAITSAWIVALIVEKLDFKGFVQHHKRVVSAKITRGFALGMASAVAGIIALAVILSVYTDIAAIVLVVGMTALISAAMMNLIAEVNPKRLFHLLAVSIPLGTAGFYLMGIFGKGWNMSTTTHGFVFVVVIILNVLLYLTVKRTRISFTVGVLFLAFFIVYPNVMSGIDAGIPYEVKADYDLEFYEVMPVFLQPDGYDTNGTNWYLGGFGYSLPLNSKYYPAGYDWLATQDQDIYPLEDRPAFLSWWDYGFEAVNEGKHPTVADNFLGGHQLAGNFILSQSEAQAVSLMIVRLLEADWKGDTLGVNRGEFSDKVVNIMEKYGLDSDVMLDIYNNPARYKQTIWDNPDIYGPRDDVIQDANARYLAARGEITENLDLEEIIDLYHDIRDATGDSIRYFAIDSRMFPFSADNTGIFYAPAKLSDHRIADAGNQPYDFWEIKAVGEFGGEYDIDDIPPDVTLDPENPYKIVYKDMFYNSMLYKCFVGYSAKDIGKSNDDGGIPAISESMSQDQIMPGWNMTHFKLVHRTAYWNPYDAKEIQNNTDAWQAMNYWDAFKKKEANDGIADLSDRSSLYQGVMMLKYYDGAIVSGKVEMDDGTPLAGVALTVQDDFGIPHHQVYTDENGEYDLIVPFGNITIITSMGTLDPRSLVGEQLNTTEMFIEDYQAMREKKDLDGDGRWDYLIDHDVEIASVDMEGKVFWDLNADGGFSPDDKVIEGARVTVTSDNFDIEMRGTTDANGEIPVMTMPPGPGKAVIEFSDREMLTANVSLTAGQRSEQLWGIKPTGLTGKVMDQNGQPAPGSTVSVWIEGQPAQTTTSDDDGNYSFENLLYGEYLLQASGNELASPIKPIVINHLQNNTEDLMMSEMYSVSGTISLPDGTPAVGARLRMISADNSSRNSLVRADEDGNFRLYVPRGKYMAAVGYPVDGVEYVHLSSDLYDGDRTSWDIQLEVGYPVEGGLFFEGERLKIPNTEVTFEGISSDYFANTFTDTDGHYSLYLPAGTYSVYASTTSARTWASFYGTAAVDSALDYNLHLSEAEETNWVVYYDINGNGAVDDGEGLEEAEIGFTDSGGGRTVAFTGPDGTVTRMLKSGDAYDVTINMPGFLGEAMSGVATEKLASEDVVKALTPEPVNIEGSIMMNDAPLMDENAYVVFTGDNSTGAQTSRVQMNRDGTYNIALFPGEYVVTLSKNRTGSDDSVIIEIDEPIVLSVGFNTGEPQLLNISVKERVKFTSKLVRDGVESSGNLTLIGPETISFDQESGTADFHAVEGEYIIRAAYAMGTDIYLETVKANITANTTLNIELRDSDKVSGILEFRSDALSGRTIEFHDTETGDVLSGITDENGDYSINLVSQRTYNAVVDFVDLDENTGIAYRYYNEKAGDKDVVLTTGGNVQTFSPDMLRERYLVPVSGKVTDLSGENSSGAIVSFIGDGAEYTATADSSGLYQVDVPPGEHLVFVQDPETRDTFMSNMTIDYVGNESLDFIISPSYKLSGTVYYDQNKHDVMTLHFTNEFGTLNTTTTPDGYYSMWLPSSEYEVSGVIGVNDKGVNVTYELLTTVNLDSDLRRNLPMSKVEEYGVSMQLIPLTAGAIAPGGSAEYLLKLTNTGNIPDTYLLTASTDPGWSVVFGETRIELDYGSVGSSETISVTVRSPRDAPVDHGAVNIKASSMKNPETSITAPADFAVEQTRDVSIMTDASDVSFTDDTLTFTATIVNDGNGPDLFTVYIANADELARQGWDVYIEGTTASSFDLTNGSWEIHNLSAAAGVETGINIVMKMNSDTPYKSVGLLMAAKSQENEDVFTSEYIAVRYPDLILGESNITITGELIDPNPNDDPALGVVVMIISVGTGLLMFYVMKKRRWLR